MGLRSLFENSMTCESTEDVKILDCLENETGEILMDQETIKKARLSVEKMVAIGR